MGAVRKSIPTIILAGLVVYFGYHGLTGEQGALAWAGYKVRIAELEQEVALVRAEREALESRASLLRDAGLDLDLVDERARDILNVSGPEDFVVRLDSEISHTN